MSATASAPELVRRPAHPALAGLVAGIVGYQQRAERPVERRQPAGSLLPLVLSFGDPLEVVALSDGEGAGRHRSFVAGFMRGHATTRFERSQRCVQVYLTPLGAYRLLGAPGRDLAGRILPVGDVAPALAGSLPDRLAAAGSWGERLALVEDAVLRLAAAGAGPEPEPFVAWMWDRIQASGGQARIGELVERTGWSGRHAVARFRDQVGLTPKAAAAVVRFEHAAADLGRLPLAQVAARHGYADQSHLTREVVRYAGEPPGVLAAQRRPTAHTALGLEPRPGFRWGRSRSVCSAPVATASAPASPQSCVTGIGSAGVAGVVEVYEGVAEFAQQR
ncbi:AraC-type DNA-binding protein [Parafrankia irregularis]|uniref:AraC-type DNA-binding protein n=2 Tax=Parafrankia irregularis TaxID=795642 RepID=A0A0S4QM03_9ACTN|nr:helix-turn-helix domain-containing protein [Parafrankia sp. CH37]CUU56079.1 AraC-type DNA-binding protein [Parafrankia irregularis]